MNQAPYQPWHPMSDPQDVKTLGKALEEVSELGSALARCLIQGIGEREPVTGKLNRQWLEEEIADVRANIDLVVDRFKLDGAAITERRNEKKRRLLAWHREA